MTVFLCKGCGENALLNPEFLCQQCIDAAIKILAEYEEWHRKWNEMSEEDKWEKAKAAL